MRKKWAMRPPGTYVVAFLVLFLAAALTAARTLDRTTRHGAAPSVLHPIAPVPRTAAPGPSPGSAISPTAVVTSGPAKRPSPTSTPQPTPSKPTPTPLTALPVRTGGITYPLSDLQSIQQHVDRGDTQYLYHLNPVLVTQRDLRDDGFTAGPIDVVSPPAPHVAPTAHHGEDGLPETDVIVRYRGREYWIVLNQFIRHGRGGIWSIITITPM